MSSGVFLKLASLKLWQLKQNKRILLASFTFCRAETLVFLFYTMLMREEEMRLPVSFFSSAETSTETYQDKILSSDQSQRTIQSDQFYVHSLFLPKQRFSPPPLFVQK